MFRFLPKCPPLYLLWVELYLSNPYLYILTPITSECDFIWKWGSYRGNQVKMRSTEQVLTRCDGCPYWKETLGHRDMYTPREDTGEDGGGDGRHQRLPANHWGSSEGAHSADTLIPTFQTPEPGDRFLSFEPHRFRWCYSSPSKPMHHWSFYFLVTVIFIV